MQSRPNRPNNKRPFTARGTTHRKRNNAHLEERDDSSDQVTSPSTAAPAAPARDERAPNASTEEPKYPRLEIDSSKPIITQTIEHVNKNGILYFGKKHKCSPRKLVIHILRHLTEPYGYRWRIVPDNKYAFDIIDNAWTLAEKKMFPVIGRVVVCPLQHGPDSGINLYFYPKFIVGREEDKDGAKGREFLARVRDTIEDDKLPFALWDNKYAWLPIVKATEEEEDNRLDVELNEEGRVGF
jgi:hypothetical protein